MPPRQNRLQLMKNSFIDMIINQQQLKLALIIEFLHSHFQSYFKSNTNWFIKWLNFIIVKLEHHPIRLIIIPDTHNQLNYWRKRQHYKHEHLHYLSLSFFHDKRMFYRYRTLLVPIKTWIQQLQALLILLIEDRFSSRYMNYSLIWFKVL